jgi:molybdate transport system substrate-binding protein
MNARSRFALIAAIVLVISLCVDTLNTAQAGSPRQRAGDSGSITVFAAASLKEAFTSIGAAFEKATGATVKFNFGGSDQLVNQLALGAPGDVLATANKTQMTIAQSKGLIGSTPVVFVRNRLVVIVPKDNPKHLYSLPDLGQPGVNLVLAAPTVPVGKYALAAFQVMASDETFGPDFLARIQRNIKSEETDVKAVVAKVSLGEADAGVVYVTDVTPQVAGQVLTIPIPPPFNQIAVYPIAVTKTSQNAALAQKFVDFVVSPVGKAALSARGFITMAPKGGYAAALTVSGLVMKPATYTVKDLETLPAVTDRITLRSDTGTLGTHTYTGVLLNTVIQQTVPISNTSFKNDVLRQFVTIGATDGYQVTVAMAEILPQFGNQQILLAYLRDGKPLGADEGAVRLIVPGDVLAGRAVTNVDSVVVGSPVGTP